MPRSFLFYRSTFRHLQYVGNVPRCEYLVISFFFFNPAAWYFIFSWKFLLDGLALSASSALTYLGGCEESFDARNAASKGRRLTRKEDLLAQKHITMYVHGIFKDRASLNHRWERRIRKIAESFSRCRGTRITIRSHKRLKITVCICREISFWNILLLSPDQHLH